MPPTRSSVVESQGLVEGGPAHGQAERESRSSVDDVIATTGAFPVPGRIGAWRCRTVEVPRRAARRPCGPEHVRPWSDGTHRRVVEGARAAIEPVAAQDGVVVQEHDQVCWARPRPDCSPRRSRGWSRWSRPRPTRQFQPGGRGVGRTVVHDNDLVLDAQGGTERLQTGLGLSQAFQAGTTTVAGGRRMLWYRAPAAGD